MKKSISAKIMKNQKFNSSAVEMGEGYVPKTRKPKPSKVLEAEKPKQGFMGVETIKKPKFEDTIDSMMILKDAKKKDESEGMDSYTEEEKYYKRGKNKKGMWNKE